MTRPFGAGLAVLLLVAGAADALAGDAAAGRAKAEAERCLTCHIVTPYDAERSASSEAKIPKLAGQDPAYLRKQLQDFRAGTRRHQVMNMMAGDLPDADIADIAAFFASLPPMRGDGRGTSARAAALVAQGDTARGIPACAGCHGTDGRQPLRGGAPVPKIAGQERPYLEFQLRDWRAGERRNAAAMNQAAQGLEDAEIEALARHLGGL